MLKTYRISQIAYFVLLPLVAGATVLMGKVAQADVAIANDISVGTEQLYAQSYPGPAYSMHSRPQFYSDPSDSDNRNHDRRSHRDSTDRTNENVILINPVLINPVIINPSSGQTVFQSPYYRPSMQGNPACTLFVSLRPACQ